jgi:predicted enzyme related to lactoylglutathione lyase
MVNFEVDDLVGLVARLAATGTQVANHHTEPFGSFAHIRDPDGNRIELFEPYG